MDHTARAGSAPGRLAMLLGLLVLLCPAAAFWFGELQGTVLIGAVTAVGYALRSNARQPVSCTVLRGQ